MLTSWLCVAPSWQSQHLVPHFVVQARSAALQAMSPAPATTGSAGVEPVVASTQTSVYLRLVAEKVTRTWMLLVLGIERPANVSLYCVYVPFSAWAVPVAWSEPDAYRLTVAFPEAPEIVAATM